MNHLAAPVNCEVDSWLMLRHAAKKCHLVNRITATVPSGKPVQSAPRPASDWDKLQGGFELGADQPLASAARIMPGQLRRNCAHAGLQAQPGLKGVRRHAWLAAAFRGPTGLALAGLLVTMRPRFASALRRGATQG